VSVAAVVLAGGSGSRVGAERNKVLLALAGESLLLRSVRSAAAAPGVGVVVVVVRPGDEDEVVAALDGAVPVPVLTAPGGATRHRSELSALRLLEPSIESGEVAVVAIHDAARPLASAGLWESVVSAAHQHGGALPTRAAAGVVRLDSLTGPQSGEDWVTVQTPQAFRARPLLAAYDAAERDDFEGTDTAACVAAYSDLRVVPVPGEATNLKVTYAEDLSLAERLLPPGGD
jgi:2-C-methyl-D-erythritol 4-phosphate cytidylyltransferase